MTQSPARDAVDLLVQHVRKMQEMAARYLEPATYSVAFPRNNTLWESKVEMPKEYDSEDNRQNKMERRTNAFVNDILRMLDGPEERAAFAALTTPSQDYARGVEDARAIVMRWGTTTRDCDIAEAIRALTPAQPQEGVGTDGWRTIETAPKDCYVLLWVNGPWPGAIRGKWDSNKYNTKPRPYWTTDDENVSGIIARRLSQPTHWMPLPESPISLASTAREG
jgi:hypothetical protein